MFLKTNFFKAISSNKQLKLPSSYWILVFLRFILTVLPQKGYLHPDEFFQNVEVIAGDVFPIDVARTWEFNPKFPIRNIFLPKLVFGIPLHFIRLLNPFTKYYFNLNLRSPYYLLVVPRLFLCLLSFINDYCLYRICIIYGQNFKNRLNIFASSYIVFVYCCRGFSNTLEMIFFSILLLHVAQCMSRSDRIIYHKEFLKQQYEKAVTPVEKVKLFKLKTHLPPHSLSSVLVVATATVMGIFNRPTFIGFSLPPLFFWLHRGLGSSVVGFKDFHYRIFVLFLCGIPATLLLILVDSAYYGYLTLADIESLELSWNNWVVTPLNFVRYNSDVKNLKSHGLHPRWLHVAVNMPLLFHVLAGIAAVALSINVVRFMRGQYSSLPRIQSITGLMMFSLVMPVGLLSIFPHQEARFIIPTLLPLVYLYGGHLYSNDGDGPWIRRLKKFLLNSWFVLNALLAIFFGLCHQAGIYSFTNNLFTEIKSNSGVHTHVIVTHSYSVPTYLLQLDSTSKVWRDRSTGHSYRLAPQTFLYKYGSLNVPDLFYKIDDILSNAEMLLHEARTEYRLYIAVPCSLVEQVHSTAKNYIYFHLVEENTYFPHFCTEAIPKFPHAHDQYCLREGSLLAKNESQKLYLNMFQRLECFVNRFCLKIYSVNMLQMKKPKHVLY